MEKGTSDEKRKALLNIYWFLLAVFAVLSAVNLFAISKDSVKAAAIVNLVLMIVIPVVFVLGYIDFRNFSPLSNKILVRISVAKIPVSYFLISL